MMKRIISVIVSIFLIMCLISVCPLAESEYVEISFCVGDETLMINGEPVVVEKPYVVGAGVTLVPLRVITEAFGAEVLWEGETKTITLKYPDVNIVLQIENPVAEINGRAEELLAAPELTPNGFTVVPLRFISENFGATVSYDETTKRITVVKEKVVTGSTVEGSIESEYIGDSYFGWSMKNPKDMSMQERSFDGRTTIFAYDDNNFIDMAVLPVSDDYDFEKDFNEFKQGAKGMTLVKADKDAEKKVMHLQAKSKTMFMDIYRIVTDKYIYSVYSEFDNQNEQVRIDALEIVSTFKLGFNKDDTYDLSNAIAGMRILSIPIAGITMMIPADYIQVGDTDVESEIHFISGDPEEHESRIDVNIYSKQGKAQGANMLATYEFTQNKQILNEEITTFSDGVSKKVYPISKETAYEYDFECKLSDRGVYNKDVFFEMTEYVCNVALSAEFKDDDSAAARKATEEIINNVRITDPDTKALGTVIYHKGEAEGTFKVDSINGITFMLPNDFEYVTSNNTRAYYSNERMACIVDVYKDFNIVDMRDMIADYEESMKSSSQFEYIKSATQTLGNRTYTVVTTFTEEGYPDTYCETFFASDNETGYVITLLYVDTFFSEYQRGIGRDIIKSIEETK